MITRNVSRGIGNHLLWVRYTSSGAAMHNIVHRANRPPLMMVHHMKNALKV